MLKFRRMLHFTVLSLSTIALIVLQRDRLFKNLHMKIFQNSLRQGPVYRCYYYM
jgi:hypothetical protein